MTLYRINWQTLLMEHCYLDMTDECYFTADYHSSCRDSIKPTILSLKCGHGWAIAHLARQLALVLPDEWTNAYTFVPMPPSSGTTSPLHSIVRELQVRDTRELITQICDTPASHGGWRPTPEQRVTLMRLNDLEVEPKPKTVVIVDDVLATGSHFRAAKMIIRETWPQMRVIGLFIARARLEPRMGEVRSTQLAFGGRCFSSWKCSDP